MSEEKTPAMAAFAKFHERLSGVPLLMPDSWHMQSDATRADWEAAATAAIDWWHAERKLEPPRSISAPVPSVIDGDVKAVIGKLRTMLATLTDRAEASGAITEDEADEYRKDAGEADL